MSSQISLIKYKKNYIGCLNNYQRSIVFGFMNNNHAIIVKKFLKYETTIINKIDDQNFIISNKNIKLKKPLYRNALYIKQYDYLNTYTYMKLNNIDFKLIDIINQDDNEILKLTSNFKMDFEIDNSLRFKNLIANINGNSFMILD
jgi:hypothetical protein